MPQHDLVLSDASGASFRSDLNDFLLAITTMQSGASEPSNPQPFMLWADTTANKIKRRNSGNSAWLEVTQSLDPTGGLHGGGVDVGDTGVVQDKLVSNANAKKWEDSANNIGGQVDETDTNSTKDKLVSNSLAKGWQDVFVELTTGALSDGMDLVSESGNDAGVDFVAGGQVNVSASSIVRKYLMDALAESGGVTIAEIGSGSSIQVEIDVPEKSTQIFFSNGNFTVPKGVTLLHVFVIGGGGGGAFQFTPTNAGGGGGGGMMEARLSVTPLDVLTIVVGTGGAGAASFGNGTAGSNSSIDTTLAVGNGGGAGTSAVGGAGGSHSTTGISIRAHVGVPGNYGANPNLGGQSGYGQNALQESTGTGANGKNRGDGGNSGANGAGKAGVVIISW